MELQQPLRVLTPTADAAVLQVLARAEAAFTGRQVARLVPDYSWSGVRRVLNRLVQQGIVEREVAGSAHLFRLNREHLAAPYVVALAELQREFERRVGDLVSRWLVPAEAVILFGSAARGEMEADSDIDLFVVAVDGATDQDSWQQQTFQLADRVTAWTGNDTRILQMAAGEARDGLLEGDGVLLAIREEGHVLYGDRRFLNKLTLPSRGARP